MKLSKHFRYFAFILLGLIGTVVLFFVSELIGFSHMNFVAFANPSYASWVYPVYFLISCLVFRKVFDISKKAIEDTKKNVDWILDFEHLKEQKVNINIFQNDVQELSQKNRKKIVSM